jgi:hypothetical protein
MYFQHLVNNKNVNANTVNHPMPVEPHNYRHRASPARPMMSTVAGLNVVQHAGCLKSIDAYLFDVM